MPLSSMTGYARSSGENDKFTWVWEIKSVNGKSLDTRIRVPSYLTGFDAVIRKIIQKNFKRGNLNISLEINHAAQENLMQINHQYLNQLIDLCQQNGDKANISQLLAVRGVVDLCEGNINSSNEKIDLSIFSDSLIEALDGLKINRREEGKRIESHINDRLIEIEKLVMAADKIAMKLPSIFMDKIKIQLDEILEPSRDVNEDRLAQEIAILATKADIREELDRLSAHVAAAKKLIDINNDNSDDMTAVGRKFEFLCQEFNREANTLCAKSSDIELTGLGLELKSSIDQLREQVANIE